MLAYLLIARKKGIILLALLKRSKTFLGLGRNTKYEYGGIISTKYKKINKLKTAR